MKTTRRDFINKLRDVSISTLFGIGFIKTCFSREKQLVIANVLDTTEVKKSFSKAMTDPISKPFGGKIKIYGKIWVDELPQGAIVKYEKDVTNVCCQ